MIFDRVILKQKKIHCRRELITDLIAHVVTEAGGNLEQNQSLLRIQLFFWFASLLDNKLDHNEHRRNSLGGHICMFVFCYAASVA